MCGALVRYSRVRGTLCPLASWMRAAQSTWLLQRSPTLIGCVCCVCTAHHATSTPVPKRPACVAPVWMRSWARRRATDRVSRARDNTDDPTGPARRTAADFEAIVTTVRRSQPLVVVVEQSDGLASHQPAEYAAADQALRELPYAWSHTCSDAHSDCGSSHVRARLLVGRCTRGRVCTVIFISRLTL
jgi:hypothetical protein